MIALQTRKTDGFVLFPYHRSIVPFQQSSFAKGSFYYWCQHFANAVLFLTKDFNGESRMIMRNAPMKNQLQFIVTTQSQWWTIFEPSWVDSLLCPVKITMITSPHDHNHPCLSMHVTPRWGAVCSLKYWHLVCVYVEVDGTGEKKCSHFNSAAAVDQLWGVFIIK